MEGLSNCYVFKSRLQEYAQKVGLTTPVYDVVKEGPAHDPSFSATVTVNDKRYDSLPGFTNRKAAEQSAAEVALLELSKSGQMKETISSPVHEIGLCKNMLQEYALKMNHAIPVYTCVKSEVPAKGAHFTCTVDVGGVKYVGGIAKSKKEAEIKAARTALLAMKHVSDDNTETPSWLTVIPMKRKVVEESTKAKKGKKKPPSKKVLGKKRKRSNEDTADVNVESNRISEALDSNQVEIILPESEKENNGLSETFNSSQGEILLGESEKGNNGVSEAFNSSQAEILRPESEKENNRMSEGLNSSQAEILLPQNKKGNSGLFDALNSSQSEMLLPESEKGNSWLPDGQAEILFSETGKGNDDLSRSLNSSQAEIPHPESGKESSLVSASYLEGHSDSSAPASLEAAAPVEA